MSKADDLRNMASAAKIYTCIKDECLSADLENGFFFLVWGATERLLALEDESPIRLDEVKESRWLNENIVLQNNKKKMSVKITSNMAILLVIPTNIVWADQGAWKRMQDYAIKRTANYKEKFF